MEKSGDILLGKCKLAIPDDPLISHNSFSL